MVKLCSYCSLSKGRKLLFFKKINRTLCTYIYYIHIYHIYSIYFAHICSAHWYFSFLQVASLRFHSCTRYIKTRKRKACCILSSCFTLPLKLRYETFLAAVMPYLTKGRVCPYSQIEKSSPRRWHRRNMKQLIHKQGNECWCSACFLAWSENPAQGAMYPHLGSFCLPQLTQHKNFLTGVPGSWSCFPADNQEAGFQLSSW